MTTTVPISHKPQHYQPPTLHDELTQREASPSSAFKKEHDATDAAAAQSKDFGFSSGSLTRGWGEGTSMAPQWRGEAPKGVTATVVE
jgi:hypothetical protein